MENFFSAEPVRQPEPCREAIYSEKAVWLCENRKTRFRTRINGALAEILKKYPQDYKLRLLSIKQEPRKDAAHELIAATGE